MHLLLLPRAADLYCRPCAVAMIPCPVSDQNEVTIEYHNSKPDAETVFFSGTTKPIKRGIECLLIFDQESERCVSRVSCLGASVGSMSACGETPPPSTTPLKETSSLSPGLPWAVPLVSHSFSECGRLGCVCVGVSQGCLQWDSCGSLPPPPSSPRLVQRNW